MAADAAATNDQTTSSSFLSALSYKRLAPCTPDADVSDTALKLRDNCRNVTELYAVFLTLHVISKEMVKYFLTLQNVCDILCILNEYTQTKS